MKVRALVGVVLKEGAAEATEINVVRRRGELHLSIRQMKDYVFPLVPYIGGLKPIEQCKPVEEFVVGLPQGERRPPEGLLQYGEWQQQQHEPPSNEGMGGQLANCGSKLRCTHHPRPGHVVEDQAVPAAEVAVDDGI
ncbi:hypothetical protein Fot_36485 [Forsythia ovata]|uniref:Uncharacterized protein n=1 Tax=Forsythia ovata TaxID=205694 RepID=A0ABD1SPK3_9LAMI